MGKPIEQAVVLVRGEEDPFSGYRYPYTNTNLHGEFELKHIKDPVVSIRVSDRKYHKIFKDIAVNQRDWSSPLHRLTRDRSRRQNSKQNGKRGNHMSRAPKHASKPWRINLRRS